MIGGELQFVNKDKETAKELLGRQNLDDSTVETVSYKKQGYVILAQGSEVPVFLINSKRKSNQNKFSALSSSDPCD